MAQSPSQNGEDFFSNGAPEQEDSFGQQESWSDSSANLPMPWLARNPQRIRRAIAQKTAMEVKVAEARIGRKLTRPEHDCMTYWTAKEYQIGSNGIPLGMLAGFYRAYATRNTFRFPFYQPPEDFNPNSLRLGNLTILEGARARLFWHINRAAVYGLIIGPVFGVLLCGSVGTFWAATGRVGDPRAKDLIQSMRQNWEAEMKKAQAERAATLAQMRGEGREGHVREEAARTGTIRDSTTEGTPQARSTRDYDASPVQEEEQAFTDPYSSRSGNTYSQEDSASPTNFSYSKPSSRDSVQSPYQRRQPQQQYPATPSSSPSPASEQSQTDYQTSNFFGDDYRNDDASPTATYPPRTQTQTQPSRRSGSAWDRIRAGTSPPNRNSSDAKSRANNPAAPSDRSEGSYPRADQDAQSARSQAQRDFDASVERERRGGNLD